MINFWIGRLNSKRQKKRSASLAHLLGKLASNARDQIRAALLQSGDQKYIDLAGQVRDCGGESVANELLEVENALIESQTPELREIEAARKRLAQGAIELCVDCGGEIGFQRLVANPVALRCFECQEKFEGATRVRSLGYEFRRVFDIDQI